MTTLEEFQALHKGLNWSNKVFILNPVLSSVLDSMKGCTSPTIAAVYINILVNICLTVKVDVSRVIDEGVRLTAEGR